MDAVKLRKNGQIAILRPVMKRLHLQGEETLLLDVTEDGSIRLRPAAVLPIELYAAARVGSLKGMLLRDALVEILSERR